MCGCLPCTHHQGPGLQPRHVPWLGIKPATIWFAGQHSVHWATPPRTLMKFFKGKIYIRWNPWKCKYIIRSVLTNVNTCVANTPIKGQNISITLQSFIILPLSPHCPTGNQCSHFCLHILILPVIDSYSMYSSMSEFFCSTWSFWY